MLAGMVEGFGVYARNWRGLAFRLLGLRRVDARTGGPVTARSALAEAAYAGVEDVLTRRVAKPRVQGERERLEALRPELEEVARAHADHPAACSRAAMDIFGRSGVNLGRGCAWQVLPSLLVWLIEALAYREGRSPRDRVTA